MLSDTNKAFGWVVLGTFAIAFSPIFVRESELGPIATAGYRVALALPVLAAWMRLEPPTGRRLTSHDWRGLILAGLFFAGDLAFWHASIAHTTIANATLFATATPVFVAVGAWLLFGERVRRRFLLGLAASLAGAAMLALASVRLSADHLIGDGLGLITAMFFSAYLLTVKKLRFAVSAARVMFWSALITAPVLFVIAAIAGERLWPTSAHGWAILIGLAWISHALGQGLVAFALARLPASFSAIGMLTEPIFAALLAWWLVSEAITILQAAGGAVILLGIHWARPPARIGPPGPPGPPSRE